MSPPLRKVNALGTPSLGTPSAMMLALSLASCQAYAPGTWPSKVSTRRHVSAAAQGGAQGDEKFMLPGIKGNPDRIGFINKSVKDIANWFGENEKGFGLLKYSTDERTAQASHILLSFEDYPDDGECDGMRMGKALKEKILEGELSFELVAEKFSACASSEKGGDLGTFKRGDMVPPLPARSKCRLGGATACCPGRNALGPGYSSHSSATQAWVAAYGATAILCQSRSSCAVHHPGLTRPCSMSRAVRRRCRSAHSRALSGRSLATT